jgi:hypothetical protein
MPRIACRPDHDQSSARLRQRRRDALDQPSRAGPRPTPRREGAGGGSVSFRGDPGGASSPPARQTERRMRRPTPQCGRLSRVDPAPLSAPPAELAYIEEPHPGKAGLGHSDLPWRESESRSTSGTSPSPRTGTRSSTGALTTPLAVKGVPARRSGRGAGIRKLPPRRGQRVQTVNLIPRACSSRVSPEGRPFRELVRQRGQTIGGIAEGEHVFGGDRDPH